jgi:PP-loop superfamily ATP-utilizing enzyme
MKTCTKCILPETYPDITFNEDGVCNYCSAHQPHQELLGIEKFIEILETRNQCGTYDCVVPLSGGKDSTYILYYVVKVLGLKPIAVSYNSGYQSQLAEKNVIRTCEILGVDLVEVNSPGILQTNLLKSSYTFADKLNREWDVCLNCPQILRIVPENIAKIHRINLVIWGGSTIESVKGTSLQQEPVEIEHEHWLIRKTKTLLRILKQLIKEPVLFFPFGRYTFFRMAQRIALGFPLKSSLKPFSGVEKSNTDIQFVNFFEYIHWDSIENVKVLEEELGWKHPADKDSRFDCQLHCVTNKKYLEKYGISHDGITFCNFIREGRMSRDEAIARESIAAEQAEEEFSVLCEGLNLKGQRIIDKS